MMLIQYTSMQNMLQGQLYVSRGTAHASYMIYIVVSYAFDDTHEMHVLLHHSQQAHVTKNAHIYIVPAKLYYATMILAT